MKSRGKPEYRLRPIPDQERDGAPELFEIRTSKENKIYKRREFVKLTTIGAVAGVVSSCDVFGSSDEQNGLSEEDLLMALYKTRAQGDIIRGLAFSPDGRFLVSGGSGFDKTIKIWEIPSGRLLRTVDTIDNSRCTVTPCGGVRHLAYSPDGRFLASLESNGYLKIRSMPDGEIVDQLFNGNKGRKLVFSPDSKFLLQTSLFLDENGTITVYDFPSLDVIDVIQAHPEERVVGDLNFSPDGRFLATAGGLQTRSEVINTIKLWEFPSFNLIRNFTTQRRNIYSLSFSPDGLLLAAGSGNGGGDLKIWDVTSGELHKNLVDHSENWFTTVLFAPDGKRVISSYDVQVRDIVSGSLINEVQVGAARNSLVLNPQGNLLAAGSGGGDIALLEYPSLKLRTFLFDSEATSPRVSASYFSLKNSAGQAIMYTILCDAKLPKEATCTCNCVEGTGPISIKDNSGGGGLGFVCSCIPVSY